MTPKGFFFYKNFYLLFLNLFPGLYLCLHVDDLHCLTSVNYCLAVQTSSEGAAPLNEWHDLNITNFLSCVPTTMK